MKTIHNTDCKRVFNRYDANCPRCQELAAGQPARTGWNNHRKAMDAQRIAAIRAHDFMACARKHIVCTCFEW